MDKLSQVKFTINSVPPSVNALYQILYNQRRVILKPEVQAWKTSIKAEIPAFDPGDSIVRVDMIFWHRWYYKNGNLRRWDAANCHKPLMDAICEKQGWDDSRVKFGSWGSVNSEQERTEVTLSIWEAK